MTTHIPSYSRIASLLIGVTLRPFIIKTRIQKITKCKTKTACSYHCWYVSLHVCYREAHIERKFALLTLLFHLFICIHGALCYLSTSIYSDLPCLCVSASPLTSAWPSPCVFKAQPSVRRDKARFDIRALHKAKLSWPNRADCVSALGQGMWNELLLWK